MGVGAVNNTVSSKLRIIPKGKEKDEFSESGFDSTGSLFDGDGESRDEVFETQALMDDGW